MAQTSGRGWYHCTVVLVSCVILCCCMDTRIFSADEWEGTSRLNVYWHSNTIDDQSRFLYLAIASKVVRPNQVYRVCVSLMPTPLPVVVRASLHRNGEEVVSASDIVDSKFSHVTNLLMKVPHNSGPGSYKLKVEGNIEGEMVGEGFRNETDVFFSERFLTILIQTNQLVYNLEQTMYIRIVLLTTELKEFTDPIDVYLIDSRDVIMKRWVSIYPYLGIVNLAFDLPYDFPEGWWTIRAVAMGQTEETKVLLERWFSHRYDVNIAVPPFVLDSDEFLEGQLLANYSSVATVTGNITFKTILRPLGKYKEMGLSWNDRYREEYVDLFQGAYDFSIPLAELRDLATPVPLEYCEIEVQAIVCERFFDFAVHAYGRSRVINSTIILQFLGISPQVFKPGMPFRTHLAVSYHDLVPIPEEDLENSEIIIRPILQTRTGDNPLKQQTLHPDKNGIAEIILNMPEDAERMTIQAYFYGHNKKDQAKAELKVLAQHSRKDLFIHITSSTKKAKAGEYAVFHVWSNFRAKSFNYLVTSKGIILMSGTETVLGNVRSITTFSIPVSAEMAPAMHTFIYHVTSEGEILADSIVIPVDAINRQPFILNINMHQERSGNLIELIPQLGPETMVGVWGYDSDHVSTHGRRQLTPTYVTEALYAFEDNFMKNHRVFRRYRDGSPETISYLTTPNYAIDTKGTFEDSNLVVLSNLLVSTMPSNCNASLGLLTCATGQCYPESQKCDGVKDCEDGSDEGSCFDAQIEQDKDLFEFYLFRRNRQGAFFDATAGNFAWKNKIIGEDQEEFIPTMAPKGPSVYFVSAVGMNRMYGLHILEEPLVFDSTKPFLIFVEGPETASIGEQIGLRVSVINYQFIEIKAEIILEASDDYSFVQVEPLGIVSSYNPRLANGEWQHLIYVKPVSHAFVHIPIVARRIGQIDVVITGRTMVAKDTAVVTIDITPDGVPVYRHTSMLLDMRNEAYIIRYLDVNVTEDPIIPFEETYRHYIFGSPAATVSVIGDVVGAPFPSGTPVGYEALRVAEPVKSAEHIMFDFAYNLYTLHYLRRTNQLQTDTMRRMLKHLNKGYVYQSVFYRNGAFNMFKGEQPSVWLTAYCARIFYLAQYPDWENYLYIDPDLLTHSMEFILDHQRLDGSFYETTDRPWNRKMDVLSQGSPVDRWQNVTLTAHVLITLTTLVELPGDARVKISNAKNLAVHYLERKLPGITDPYQVAIVTHALLEAGSIEAEVGFNKLEDMKRDKEGMVYWSPEPIASNDILYQNQRPFILPRLPGKYDSVAVEATAYALLVYIRYNGLLQDRIVRWLNSMRNTDTAFISSQDTIVALQALIEYSFETHVRDITSMKVTVESSANPGNIHALNISINNLAESRRVDILPNVWGHAEVKGQGQGLSVLQLDVSYNVDKNFLLIQPPVPAFDLTVRSYFNGRNKSNMHIESCAKWTYVEESETSGVAVIEIGLPTGYFVHKPDMDKYVYSRVVPRLQRGRVYPKSAVFMFDYLDAAWSCVNFTLQRWYPVANLSRFLKARVYDYYTPERYKEIIYEDFDLYVLNVCEVCGSYQCPYCPYFSIASQPHAQWIIIIVSVIIQHIFTKDRLFFFT